MLTFLASIASLGASIHPEPLVFFDPCSPVGSQSLDRCPLPFTSCLGPKCIGDRRLILPKPSQEELGRFLLDVDLATLLLRLDPESIKFG
jgi:hypothetical protein